MSKEKMLPVSQRLYRAIPCQNPYLDDKVRSKWFRTPKEAYQYLRHPEVWGGYYPMIQEIDIDIPDVQSLADLLTYGERYRFDRYPDDLEIESIMYVNDEWSKDSDSEFLKRSWSWHERNAPKDAGSQITDSHYEDEKEEFRVVTAR
jgi:hypothetical protein